jgi:hypothetical protein
MEFGAVLNWLSGTMTARSPAVRRCSTMCLDNVSENHSIRQQVEHGGGSPDKRDEGLHF